MAGVMFLGRRAAALAKRAKTGGKREAICTLRMVPITATPTVPPMVRKNWVEAVATPRRFHGTAFCTARIKAVLERPSPVPMMNIATTIKGSVVAVVKSVTIAVPMVASVMPRTAVMRYP